MRAVSIIASSNPTGTAPVLRVKAACAPKPPNWTNIQKKVRRNISFVCATINMALKMSGYDHIKADPEETIKRVMKFGIKNSGLMLAKTAVYAPAIFMAIHVLSAMERKLDPKENKDQARNEHRIPRRKEPRKKFGLADIVLCAITQAGKTMAAIVLKIISKPLFHLVGRGEGEVIVYIPASNSLEEQTLKEENEIALLLKQVVFVNVLSKQDCSCAELEGSRPKFVERGLIKTSSGQILINAKDQSTHAANNLDWVIELIDEADERSTINGTLDKMLAANYMNPKVTRVFFSASLYDAKAYHQRNEAIQQISRKAGKDCEMLAGWIENGYVGPTSSCGEKQNTMAGFVSRPIRYTSIEEEFGFAEEDFSYVAFSKSSDFVIFSDKRDEAINRRIERNQKENVRIKQENLYRQKKGQPLFSMLETNPELFSDRFPTHASYRKFVLDNLIRIINKTLFDKTYLDNAKNDHRGLAMRTREKDVADDLAEAISDAWHLRNKEKLCVFAHHSGLDLDTARKTKSTDMTVKAIIDWHLNLNSNCDKYVMILADKGRRGDSFPAHCSNFLDFSDSMYLTSEIQGFFGRATGYWKYSRVYVTKEAEASIKHSIDNHGVSVMKKLHSRVENGLMRTEQYVVRIELDEIIKRKSEPIFEQVYAAFVKIDTILKTAAAVLGIKEARLSSPKSASNWEIMKIIDGILAPLAQKHPMILKGSRSFSDDPMILRAFPKMLKEQWTVNEFLKEVQLGSLKKLVETARSKEYLENAAKGIFADGVLPYVAYRPSNILFNSPIAPTISRRMKKAHGHSRIPVSGQTKGPRFKTRNTNYLLPIGVVWDILENGGQEIAVEWVDLFLAKPMSMTGLNNGWGLKVTSMHDNAINQRQMAATVGGL